MAFNQLLMDYARTGGFDAVFVDKGVWIWPGTLRALKDTARWGLAIHFTPDAQFLENRSRHFYRALPDYDLAITTKTFEIDAYRKAGAPEIKLLLQGHGRHLAPVDPAGIPADLRSEVAFVGHCQSAYAVFLKILSARVPLSIWGPGWVRHARRNAWAQGVVRNDGMYGADYACALSGAKIALGLLSKRIPETTTTRTFEIPACGTMLLAERTEDHQSLFEEGVEAEFFDSAEECADKARFYLADDAARERIAAAGLRRCRASGYSTQAQFRTIVDWVAAHRPADGATAKKDV
ncbi:MAG: glycosyltransferase [Alteriqipengyuania sp.]